MKSVRALLQFTTILPLGEPADFDAFAQRSWLYPFAGYVAGAVAAVPGLAAWYLLPVQITSMVCWIWETVSWRTAAAKNGLPQ